MLAPPWRHTGPLAGEPVVSGWLWLLVCVVLVAASAGYLFLAVRSLWRKVRALAEEAQRAAETVEALEGESERLREARGAAGVEVTVLAIFEDPARLAREREATRRALAQRRRAARAARYPRWARSVD